MCGGVVEVMKGLLHFTDNLKKSYIKGFILGHSTAVKV